MYPFSPINFKSNFCLVWPSHLNLHLFLSQWSFSALEMCRLNYCTLKGFLISGRNKPPFIIFVFIFLKAILALFSRWTFKLFWKVLKIYYFCFDLDHIEFIDKLWKNQHCSIGAVLIQGWAMAFKTTFSLVLLSSFNFSSHKSFTFFNLFSWHFPFCEWSILFHYFFCIAVIFIITYSSYSQSSWISHSFKV